MPKYRHQSRVAMGSPKIGEKSRVRFAVLMLCLLFVMLLARGLYIQLFSQDFLQNQGDARFRRVLKLEAIRGQITDRNGAPLAISAQVKSIWASPADMEKLPAEQIEALAKLLELSPETVTTKLADKKKEFVYLKRQISPEQADKILALAIPGIASQSEYKRFYPSGESFAHIIGFTGIDGVGQEGLELARDRMLAGKPGSRVVLKDRRGHIVDDLAAVEQPRDGQALVLSMDQRLQYLAYRELKAVVDANKAKAGSVVVLDAQTGEILALVNMPTYNPNIRNNINPESRRNRAVVDLFEAGSAMKPMPVAKALDAGKVTPMTVMNTQSYMIGPAVVRDTHNYPSLSVTGIIQKSSNVGSSKLSLMFSPQEMWTFYDEMGFGRSAHSGFPGESNGHLRNWKNWRPIEQATMSFGYGVSMSLLQLARAYTIFTTDGQLLPVTFVKQNAPLPGKRMISARTAQQMREMMTTVTQQGGTGVRAQVLGYNVGGKSGTVRKLEKGVYQSNKHIGIFVGFAPATYPRLIVAVMIDEPSAGAYYGGSVAGPAFAQIMAGGLRILGVPPDSPTSTKLIPVNQIQEVREET